VHGVSGNLGWAAAPVFLAAVAALSSWRGALAAAAAIPFGVLCLLLVNRTVLLVEVRPAKTTEPAGEGSFGFLRLPQVWMCFAFFFLSAVALAGIQSFASTGLVAIYGVSLATATSAYTVYMLASAGGMVLGGFLATRSSNHDRTIAAAFALAALLALVIASGAVPAVLVKQRVIGGVEHGVAAAGKHRAGHQARVVGCGSQHQCRSAEQRQPREQHRTRADAVDHEAGQRLPDAGHDEEDRHQEAQLGVGQPERGLNPGEQPREDEVEEVRHAVREADQADHARVLAQVCRRHFLPLVFILNSQCSQKPAEAPATGSCVSELTEQSIQPA
jgi:hypothetical protein